MRSLFQFPLCSDVSVILGAVSHCSPQRRCWLGWAASLTQMLLKRFALCKAISHTPDLGKFHTHS